MFFLLFRQLPQHIIRQPAQLFYFGIRVVLDVRANTDFVHCTNCHEQDNQWRFGRHAGACCRQKAKSGFNWSKWTNCWLPNDSEIHQHAIGWGGTVNERLKAFPDPCVAKVQHPIAPCQWQKDRGARVVRCLGLEGFRVLSCRRIIRIMMRALALVFQTTVITY